MEQHEAVTPDTIDRVMGLMKGSFENIVIDTARYVTPTAAAAFSHADVILVVCQLLVPSVRNAKRYVDALTGMGIPGDRIEIVVNRGDGRSGRLNIKDLEEMIQKPVFGCVPNDYQFVARSIDFGRPIASLDQNSPVRTAIRKIAQQIVAGSGPENTKRERRGFFGRLLTK